MVARKVISSGIIIIFFYAYKLYVTESDKRGLLTHFMIFELLISCD